MRKQYYEKPISTWTVKNVCNWATGSAPNHELRTTVTQADDSDKGSNAFQQNGKTSRKKKKHKKLKKKHKKSEKKHKKSKKKQKSKKKDKKLTKAKKREKRLATLLFERQQTRGSGKNSSDELSDVILDESDALELKRELKRKEVRYATLYFDRKKAREGIKSSDVLLDEDESKKRGISSRKKERDSIENSDFIDHMDSIDNLNKGKSKKKGNLNYQMNYDGLKVPKNIDDSKYQMGYQDRKNPQKIGNPKYQMGYQDLNNPQKIGNPKYQMGYQDLNNPQKNDDQARMGYTKPTFLEKFFGLFQMGYTKPTTLENGDGQTQMGYTKPTTLENGDGQTQMGYDELTKKSEKEPLSIGIIVIIILICIASLGFAAWFFLKTNDTSPLDFEGEMEKRNQEFEGEDFVYLLDKDIDKNQDLKTINLSEVEVQSIYRGISNDRRKFHINTPDLGGKTSTWINYYLHFEDPKSPYLTIDDELKDPKIYENKHGKSWEDNKIKGKRNDNMYLFKIDPVEVSTSRNGQVKKLIKVNAIVIVLFKQGLGGGATAKNVKYMKEAGYEEGFIWRYGSNFNGFVNDYESNLQILKTDDKWYKSRGMIVIIGLICLAGIGIAIKICLKSQNTNDEEFGNYDAESNDENAAPGP